MSRDKRREMETIGQSRCMAAKSGEEVESIHICIHTYPHTCYVNMYINPSVGRKVERRASIGLLATFIPCCFFCGFLSLYNTNFMFSAFALLVGGIS